MTRTSSTTEKIPPLNHKTNLEKSSTFPRFRVCSEHRNGKKLHKRNEDVDLKQMNGKTHDHDRKIRLERSNLYYRNKNIIEMSKEISNKACGSITKF